jgi:hypothetical protein
MIWYSRRNPVSGKFIRPIQFVEIRRKLARYGEKERRGKTAENWRYPLAGAK